MSFTTFPWSIEIERHLALADISTRLTISGPYGDRRQKRRHLRGPVHGTQGRHLLPQGESESYTLVNSLNSMYIHRYLELTKLFLLLPDHDFLAAHQGLPAVHRGDGAQPAAHFFRRPRHQGTSMTSFSRVLLGQLSFYPGGAKRPKNVAQLKTIPSY